jgi:quercetin dioxygenase-like cupin family protein
MTERMSSRTYTIMRKPLFMFGSILSFAATSTIAEAQPKIERRELYKANIGAQPVSTVDVREIVFQPKQMTGLHRRPCPVVSYIVEGTITFQIRGQKVQTLRAGQVCYEPAGAIIEHFDNASDRTTAKFIPYYLLNGRNN